MFKVMMKGWKEKSIWYCALLHASDATKSIETLNGVELEGRQKNVSCAVRMEVP